MDGNAQNSEQQEKMENEIIRSGTLRCPTCNAKLHYATQTGKILCFGCGSIILVGEFTGDVDVVLL